MEKNRANKKKGGKILENQKMDGKFREVSDQGVNGVQVGSYAK